MGGRGGGVYNNSKDFFEAFSMFTSENRHDGACQNNWPINQGPCLAEALIGVERKLIERRGYTFWKFGNVVDDRWQSRAGQGPRGGVSMIDLIDYTDGDTCRSCGTIWDGMRLVFLPGTGRSRPGGGISMKDLIDYEIIWPGEDVLSVEYKGNVTYATLLPEGHILCKVEPPPPCFLEWSFRQRGCPMQRQSSTLLTFILTEGNE